MVRDFRNELLKRREVEVVFNVESNPGFEKSKQMISEKMKIAPELIVIKELKSRFGTQSFMVHALLYDSADDLKRIEPKAKVKKEAGGAK